MRKARLPWSLEQQVGCYMSHLTKIGEFAVEGEEFSIVTSIESQREWKTCNARLSIAETVSYTVETPVTEKFQVNQTEQLLKRIDECPGLVVARSEGKLDELLALIGGEKNTLIGSVEDFVDQYLNAGNPLWRGVGCLALAVATPVGHEDRIEEGCSRILKGDHDIYVRSVALTVLALIGRRPEGAFENAKKLAHHDYRLQTVSGWNRVAGVSETPDERKEALNIILANIGNRYRDMGPYVLPCSFIVPESEEDRRQVAEKILEQWNTLNSSDRVDHAVWALSLVGMALTGNECDKIFQKSKRQRQGACYRETKFALLAMALAAQTPELKEDITQQCLGILQTLKRWNGHIALSALLSLAIVEANDRRRAERVAATLLYGEVFW